VKQTSLAQKKQNVSIDLWQKNFSAAL